MRQVYYGWYVVAIAMVIYSVILGSTYAAFGIFVHPVSAELKLSRADMNTALILVNLGNAVLAPFIGRFLDKISLKHAMVACGLLFALGYVGLGLSHSIPLSALILAFVIPTAYLGGCSITMTMLLARWFTAQRGRAMTLAGVGMSLGNVIITPAMGLLVKTYDWRMALVISGVAIGALVVLMGLIVRERPGPGDVETGAQPAATAAPQAQGEPLKIAAVLKMPQFWLISLSTAFSLGVFQTLAATLIPLAQEGGASLIRATGLMPIVGAFAIAGGLLLAVVADKIDRVILLSMLFLVGALINALLLTSNTYPLLVVCAALMGMGAGTIAHLFYALLADRFGTATFGSLRGLTLFVISGTGMVSIRIAGEIFDRTGGYHLLFVTFIAMSVAAAALMFATRFTRKPLLTAAQAASAT